MASQHKFALHYFIIKPNLDIPCLKDLSFNKCYEENTHTLCIFSLVLVFEFLVFWVVTKTQTTASINMSIFVCQNFSKQTKMIYRSDCLFSSHSVSKWPKIADTVGIQYSDTILPYFFMSGILVLYQQTSYFNRLFDNVRVTLFI